MVQLPYTFDLWTNKERLAYLENRIDWYLEAVAKSSSNSFKDKALTYADALAKEMQRLQVGTY